MATNFYIQKFPLCEALIELEINCSWEDVVSGIQQELQEYVAGGDDQKGPQYIEE